MRMVCYVVGWLVEHVGAFRRCFEHLDTGSGVLTLFHTRGSPVKQCEYLLCSVIYRSKGHDLR